MTPLSRRFIRPLLLVMIPVSVPVLVHSYGDSKAEDCSNVDALFPAAGLSGGAGTERNSSMWYQFRAVKWAEGAFAETDPPLQLEFVIIRSYDPKRLYHRPETYFRQQTSNSQLMKSITRNTGSMPIHVVRYEQPELAQVVAYLLVYNSKAVANPYLAQVAAFPSQLITGAKPMTSFLILGSAPRTAAQTLEDRAAAWLADAWERYESACLAGAD
jgi:hypothetical protein